MVHECIILQTIFVLKNLTFLLLFSHYLASVSSFPRISIVSHSGAVVLQCKADTDNTFDLNVQLSRGLAWDCDKQSWRWHKTWRVPDCLVTANADALHGIADLEAHLFVVCQADRPHHLEDAGIQSHDRSTRHATLQLVDGRCRFSRLRLIATTSTSGGSMFHFVVSIVKRDGDTVTALASVISTAFAVYSRKNADKKRKVVDRESMISGRWSEGYSFVPFPPKELDRKFIKKTTNAQGVLLEEEITNSWEGLLSYFQAPNIRFKIRHPLFLAIRFSTVLTILRDSLRFPHENEDALRSFICSCGFPLNSTRDPAVMIAPGKFLPPWLIAFRKSSMVHCKAETVQKLADLMKVVKGPALGFVPDDSLLPPRYSRTFNVENLRKLYSKLYDIEFSGEKDRPMESNVIPLSGKHNCISAHDPPKRPKCTIEEKINRNGSNEIRTNHTTDICDIDAPDNKSAELVEKVADTVSSSCEHKTSERVRSSFENYFMALHKDLRTLLQNVVELVSQCVTSPNANVVENLRKAYKDFTDALSVHAFMEDHVLFKTLAIRVPKVAESYTVDHEIEKGRMEEISNLMRNVDPKKVTDLFLKISELAALHNNHMDKEEHHLLPYFFDNFDDTEIVELIGQCENTTNHLSLWYEKGKLAEDEKVNIQQAQHLSDTDRTNMVTGASGSTVAVADPPDCFYDCELFSGGQPSADGRAENRELSEQDQNSQAVSNLTSGPGLGMYPLTRGADDVLSLMEDMYR